MNVRNCAIRNCTNRKRLIIMLLPRQLIYEEHPIEWFRLDDSSSIFHVFYEQMLEVQGMRLIDRGAREKIQMALNDACYICTDVQFQQIPRLMLGDYIEIPTRTRQEGNFNCGHVHAAAAVMSCVRYLLLNKEGARAEELLLANDIDCWLREQSYRSEIYEPFFHALDKNDSYKLKAEQLKPRSIDKDFADNFDWQKITDNYNVEDISFIVHSVGQSDNERMCVINSIREEVKSKEAKEIGYDSLPF